MQQQTGHRLYVGDWSQVRSQQIGADFAGNRPRFSGHDCDWHHLSAGNAFSYQTSRVLPMDLPGCETTSEIDQHRRISAFQRQPKRFEGPWTSTAR